jgi:hypothetical protein
VFTWGKPVLCIQPACWSVKFEKKGEVVVEIEFESAFEELFEKAFEFDVPTVYTIFEEFTGEGFPSLGSSPQKIPPLGSTSSVAQFENKN